MIRTTKFKIDNEDKFIITDNGFLKCRAKATRSGIFVYHDDKGNPIRELRPPEEVFKKESLDSLKLAPLSFHHPKEGMINSENIGKLQIGTIGEDIKQDGGFIDVPVLITDKKTVDFVLDKKEKKQSVELSCGYKADIKDKSGDDSEFGKFDSIQKDIIYNHVAVVTKGRAGSEVKLKLDKKEKKSMAKFTKGAVKKDGFNMDAINEDVADESLPVLTRLSGKLDESVVALDQKTKEAGEFKAEQSTLQGKFDSAEEEVKKLKADLEDYKNPNSEKVQSMLKDRKDLEAVCEAYKVDHKGKTTLQAKTECVSASSESFVADGKDENYISARFDHILETLETETKNKADASDMLGAIRKDAHKAKGEETDPRKLFMLKSSKLGNKNKEENK